MHSDFRSLLSLAVLVTPVLASRSTAGSAAVVLTGIAADGGADAAASPSTTIQLLVRNSGGVSLIGDAATAVTAINITAPSGGLPGGTHFTPEFNALFPDTAANNANQINAFNTFANGADVNGLIDMGFSYFGDHNLTFQFSQKGVNRNALQDGVILYGLPAEPTTLCTFGMAGFFLLQRRRKSSGVTYVNDEPAMPIPPV